MPNASRGRYRLTVRSEFSASHSLRNFRGKCEALHGHNFGVEVQVEGSELDPDCELLVDFGVLKRDVKEILEHLDHCFLNETEPFHEENPTSENLARYIYGRLALKAPTWTEGQNRVVRVAAVTVSEKAAQSATYYELDEPNAASGEARADMTGLDALGEV